MLAIGAFVVFAIAAIIAFLDGLAHAGVSLDIVLGLTAAGLALLALHIAFGAPAVAWRRVQ